MATMAKLPSFQFYPGDWRKDPGVQSLEYHDRGVWWEMLCLMHECEPRGKLAIGGRPIPPERVATMLGLLKQNYEICLSRLLDAGVAARESDTGIVYCRRMVRDEHIRSIRSAAGKTGGNPILLKQKSTNHLTRLRKQKPTPSSSSSSSSSSSEENNNNNPPMSPHGGDEKTGRGNASPRGPKKQVYANDPLWVEVAARWFGGDVPRDQVRRVNRIVAALADRRAVPDEIGQRIRRYRSLYPEREPPTPEALIKFWADAAPPARSIFDDA
jgi:hypothetical protein